MKFYLKVINPAIAFIVLGLCYWASSTGGEEFTFLGPWTGGMYTYFFAKGLFTCSTLLILGKILLSLLYEKESGAAPAGLVLACAGLVGITASAFLWIHLAFVAGEQQAEPETVQVTNPSEIVVTDSYRIHESRRLKIGVRVKDQSETEWKSVEFCAGLYMKDRLIGECSCSRYDFTEQREQSLVIDCDDFLNADVSESLRYDVTVRAKRKADEEDRTGQE